MLYLNAYIETAHTHIYFIFSWHIIQFKNTKLQSAVECTLALPLRLLVIIQAVVDVPQWCQSNQHHEPLFIKIINKIKKETWHE